MLGFLRSSSKLRCSLRPMGAVRCRPGQMKPSRQVGADLRTLISHAELHSTLLS